VTAISPCIQCSPSLKEGCELRESFKAKIAGLGLTSARFRCQRRLDAFRPGRRVLATLTSAIQVDFGSYDPDVRYSDAKAPGTIVGDSMKRGRVLVWIDDGEIERQGLSLKNESGLCSLPGQKLVLLDEPDRPERVAELEARDQAQMQAAFEEFA
jgi:hypothetical protein